MQITAVNYIELSLGRILTDFEVIYILCFHPFSVTCYSPFQHYHCPQCFLLEEEEKMLCIYPSYFPRILQS